MTDKLEDIAKMCSTKILVMKDSYVSDSLLYCRTVCSGIPESTPCPFGRYKPIGEIRKY